MCARHALVTSGVNDMTPDHMAILIDLFLKSCGVVLLAVIALRWKSRHAAADPGQVANDRRSTDKPAMRVYRSPIDHFCQDSVSTLEFVPPGKGFRRR